MSTDMLKEMQAAGMSIENHTANHLEVIHKGLVFHKARQEDDNDGKVRTKAKKKAYRTGAHGSASAIKKANIRKHRAEKSKRSR